MARLAYRSGETTGTSFRPGSDGDGVTMVQHRPTHGPHVESPNLGYGDSVARTTLDAGGARIVFSSTRRADG